MLWPCHSSQGHSTARPCCGLEKNGMVRAWHGSGMASVNQTRPYCVNEMGKTHSKPLAARHGRGTAWARHGNGMLCVNRPLLFLNNGLPVNSLPPLSIYVGTRAALTRVLNELCDPPASWSSRTPCILSPCSLRHSSPLCHGEDKFSAYYVSWKEKLCCGAARNVSKLMWLFFCASGLHYSRCSRLFKVKPVQTVILPVWNKTSSHSVTDLF